MKKKSRILKEIHETAAGLHKLGFIDKRAMERYDALCIPEVPDYSSEDVKTIRKKFKLSQSAFALVLNTSASTVRQWENGSKNPSKPSKKLLNILDRKGLESMI